MKHLDPGDRLSCPGMNVETIFLNSDSLTDLYHAVTERAAETYLCRKLWTSTDKGVEEMTVSCSQNNLKLKAKETIVMRVG